jgi:NDP-sugar pyrophosphorylase family protein
MKPTLIVLAAGMGSRYGSLKQVDKLGPGGETIIDYSVFDAIRAGFGKAVFVIRKSIEKDFIDVFADRFLKKIPYEIVFQELDMLPEGFICPEERTKPWGTAHALWVCREVVKEPFVVINADDFYGKEAYQVLADHLKQNPQHDSSNFAMCGYRLDNTLSEHGMVTRGICSINDEGYLQSVDEQFNIGCDETGKIVSYMESGNIALDPDVTVSMNIWAFNPSIFQLIEEYFIKFLEKHIRTPKSELLTPQLVDKIIKEGKGKIKVLQSASKWFGVTYANDKPLVMQKLKELKERKEYPANLFE